MGYPLTLVRRESATSFATGSGLPTESKRISEVRRREGEAAGEEPGVNSARLMPETMSKEEDSKESVDPKEPWPGGFFTSSTSLRESGEVRSELHTNTVYTKNHT